MRPVLELYPEVLELESLESIIYWELMLFCGHQLQKILHLFGIGFYLVVVLK